MLVGWARDHRSVYHALRVFPFRRAVQAFQPRRSTSEHSVGHHRGEPQGADSISSRRRDAHGCRARAVFPTPRPRRWSRSPKSLLYETSARRKPRSPALISSRYDDTQHARAGVTIRAIGAPTGLGVEKHLMACAVRGIPASVRAGGSQANPQSRTWIAGFCRTTAVLALACLTSACLVGPDYARPSVETPLAFK